MQLDNTTLKDLSIFGAGGGGGVFAQLDRTSTAAGREALRRHVQQPPADFETLQAVQDTVRWWSEHPESWATNITNGTLVMLEKFFESADSVSPPSAGIGIVMGAFLQRIFNKNEYTFVQFSLSHLSDLMRGSKKLVTLLDERDTAPLPALLRAELEALKHELEHPLTEILLAITPKTPYTELTRIAYRARRELKTTAQRIELHFARMDAWQSMASACREHGWSFPQLGPALPVRLEARGLRHPLVAGAVSYDVSFSQEEHFLFLTGANMSGKTTLLRALGVSALLAHIGCGVPAAALHLSFLQGIITNMHVEDNILKGESYFFAEVQRMKNTALRIRGDQPHLVLMDELFKGTNVHDAYECTRAVVDGLLTHPHHLMILSTHLHEVAQHFEARRDMQFAYFVTDTAADGSFRFTYQLRPGISHDRIGYRILQQEGVIDLLKRI